MSKRPYFGPSEAHMRSVLAFAIGWALILALAAPFIVAYLLGVFDRMLFGAIVALGGVSLSICAVLLGREILEWRQQ